MVYYTIFAPKTRFEVTLMQVLLFAVFAYLIGSISSAIIISKLLKLPDPRSFGSGNPGATNVLRSGSKAAAAATLIGDALKGSIPVWCAYAFSGEPAVVAVSAIGAFLGHLYPVYYGFKGGKGVATALGVFLAANPYIFLVMVITWLLTAALSKMSSLAALVAAAVALPCSFMFWQSLPMVGATFVIVALLFLRHRPNIERILAGTESKIGDKK